MQGAAKAMTLPYDMGNAGDLLKHGVLAEYVRWHCGLGLPLRFLDPFGGEPWGDAKAEVTRRVRALTGSALRMEQVGIDGGCYYGSGLLVRRTAEAAGCAHVVVLAGDACAARRQRLREAGLGMLEDEFARRETDVGHDAYDALTEIVRGARRGDLVLIDPFFDNFLEDRASAVVAEMAEMAAVGAALLFALRPDHGDDPGRRFDALVSEHLPGAWRMSCPPVADTDVRGESKYHAEVVLAARPLLTPESAEDAAVLAGRLTSLAGQLARVLRLPVAGLDCRVVR